MGVNYLVLDKGETELVVGGVVNRLGSLRDVGKVHSGTRRLAQAAGRAWKGREMPRAVFAEGRAGMGRGVEGAIYGWEAGLASTNDHDWNGMPLLGVARLDAEGRLELYAHGGASRPMTLEEAREQGVVGDDGLLKGWRQARVVRAEALEGESVPHANESSRGPVRDLRHKLVLEFDDGRKDEQELYVQLSAAAVESAGRELVGKTRGEAWDWAQARQARAWVQEGREVSALPGHIVFEAGGVPVALVGSGDPAYPGEIMVRTKLGGIGMAQSAEHAFQDAGDRLATYVGGTIRCVPGSGELQMSVGGALSIAVTAGREGEVVVTSSVPGASGEAETVVVPPEAAGPFLADFSLYLAECSGASLALGDERQGRLPTFGGFLEATGVDYAAPGSGPRP